MDVVEEHHTDQGATLVQYALLVTLIALLAVGSMAFLGQATARSAESVGTGLGGDPTSLSETTTTTATPAATTAPTTTATPPPTAAPTTTAPPATVTPTVPTSPPTSSRICTGTRCR